jgi:hypothetical protein
MLFLFYFLRDELGWDWSFGAVVGFFFFLGLIAQQADVFYRS